MRKFIVTHESEGRRHGNSYIIASHYDHSLAAFQNLVAEARKDFVVDASDVECRTVRESRWCKGSPVIHFPCQPDIIQAGWESTDKLPDVII